jgi:polar amino acid transport system substrate-binding protein
MNKVFRTLLVLCLFCNAGSAAEPIRLMTEEFPPFQYYEGKKLTGVSVEIVRALQGKIGSADSILVYPWTRGLRLLERTSNTALFSTLRTEGREEKYKWVGPLAELRMVFFKKAGSPIELTSVDDAKKLAKVGVSKNVGGHEVLVRLGFTNLDVLESGADETNIKKLVRGRIDAWPSSYLAGLHSAKKMGLQGQIEAITNVNIMSGHLYLAFNKNTDDAIIKSWQAGLDELQTNDVVDTIIAKYRR